MKAIKLVVLFCVVVFAVSCAKPPMKAYDDAQAALKSAQGYEAEKCAPVEYAEANELMKAAEEKMEDAKNQSSKSKNYEQAEKDLIAAKAKAVEAEKIAKERRAESDKLAVRLEELRKEIDAVKSDASKYSPSTYSQLEDKYSKAKQYIDDCKPNEAKALIAEIEELLKKNKEEIAAAKAEELKQSMAVQKVAASETYTVAKGDCLWNISDRKYMNPFMWPLIYWANKDKIKDPDLIFPGQIFEIKKDYSDNEKNDAIHFSKTRGPWSLFDGK